ncbi:MAG: ATP-binding cassette domain-containing protein [Cyclobacteriaceae bacterium]|nr:ATP-binding cassette domain-containing protein [Cyclobacteriaceae bacterium]
MDPIKLHNLSHQIGNRTILSNLSIDFPENKVIAIIGKSGSGKSTLIKMINGLLKPTKGDVSVFEQKINYQDLQSLRRKIGYVVQGVGLFPHLTIEENILLTGKAHSPRQLTDSKRLYELMNLVGLSDHLYKKFPHELSGGEQQRAGICRALFLDPFILLMDEPFGSLDPSTRFDIHEEFLRLQNTAPRTVLMVTHDMREAKKLADRILVIHAGTIQQFGPASEIFDHPATSVVEELITESEL